MCPNCSKEYRLVTGKRKVTPRNNCDHERRHTLRHVDYFCPPEGPLLCAEIATHDTLRLVPHIDDDVREQFAPCHRVADVLSRV